jgi:hypothetical protein
MTDTSTPSTRISGSPSGVSYVDWPAIFAGAIIASAIIVLMTAFGSAIGLSLQERALAVGAEAPSLLAGLIVDAGGNRMTPTHATKKAKRYRY